MKLFPERNYIIELNKDCSLGLLELKNQTLLKDQFVAGGKRQCFIGKVEKNKFEVKLSKNLIGEFCVLKGKLEKEKGTLEIRTSRTIKIFFIAIILFIISGIITMIIQTKFELIFPLVVMILITRFIFMEFGFRFVSKLGIEKLTTIIGIEKIE